MTGIDPKAREIAADLARRSGLSLGEWLNSMIVEAEEPVSSGGSRISRGAVLHGRRPSYAEMAFIEEDSRETERTGWSLFGRKTRAPDTPLLITLDFTFDLLGGRAVINREIRNPLDAHEMLQAGLPARSLIHLVDRVHLLQAPANFERAVGMSQRTLLRRREEPKRPLNPEQSGRTWKFAELLAKATNVLGSQERAEDWLVEPAIGLNQHAPLDLLSTAAGLEAVEEYLGRLEYGVYA
ncbi:type II RES/Xre toxin-antitoxin system antitoxin [Brevundimonas sp. CEF1]|uniref:type II RES/Xre toxin-antitoxin system antitoxin n=1 Tax=Brevundimonas sp. CEF1 TaxID=3442642 RepID=UPI003F517D2C